ncbi:MAG: class I SAM-dependent methyltransferase [Pseudonocardiales bacterium]|nr:class I SAM-dependent methyltransferase [Pseudonocardiales bacterium]MBV9029457.1 class I SAM-dependent methyltransferase [Pseudonocardiales bacterium]
MTDSGVLASPNIWNWPEVYERENQAVDADGALWVALADRVDWDGADVVDVGCGDGFHLPRFAERARGVVGVEPHPPLVTRARRRVRALPNVSVIAGRAQRLPLPDSSADLVHARVAYFFGPGCERGLAQARRVLRPGGTMVVIDLDGTHAPYGEWLCAAAPRYRPATVEAFFAAQGFDCRRVDTVWRFRDRGDLEAALRIEFTPEVAARAIAATPGLTIPVRYRLHLRREPTGLAMGRWTAR